MDKLGLLLLALAFGIGIVIGITVAVKVSQRNRRLENERVLNGAAQMIENGFSTSGSPASGYIPFAVDSLLESAYGSTKIKDLGLKTASLNDRLNKQCREVVSDLLQKLQVHDPLIGPAATHRKIVEFLRAGGLLYSDFETSEHEVESHVVATVAERLHAMVSEMGEGINDNYIQGVHQYAVSLQPYASASIPLKAFYDDLRFSGKSYLDAVTVLADELERRSNISRALMPASDPGPAATSASASWFSCGALSYCWVLGKPTELPAFILFKVYLAFSTEIL